MAAATLAEAVDRIQSAETLLLLTHEHPDGDAIGSLVGLHRILLDAGIESEILVRPDDRPAAEYDFLIPGERVAGDLPADLSGTTLVVLDSGNLERSAAGQRGADSKTIINIDHHHDNTRYGELDYVDADASCTAEIVWQMAPLLGAEIDQLAAAALYVGLVTDTGRFMYGNTGVEAHRMAADLIERGVQVSGMFRRIYEGVPEGRARLLGRALSKVERHLDGQVTLVWLTRQDFDDCEASDGWSEGIVDHLRAMRGTRIAGVIREPKGSPETKRISLRAATDEVDVSAIARAGGGGGHPGAAGFSSDLPHGELIDFIVSMASEAGQS